MKDLVSPLQSSFIPGRGTHDNIFVLQEIIHSLRRSKNKKGGMIIKLDLEKVYDKTNWDFFEQTLHFFELPPHLLEFIIFCVKCVKPRVLWNGKPFPSISPSYGLSQGDPLSPYLFVICVGCLSYLIEHSVEEGTWKPISVCRGGPKLSHVFVADDLIFLAQETRDNAINIDKLMGEFCACFSLKVNKNKSRIFFSRSTRHGLSRSIAKILDFSCTMDLGKYLGVPLVHNGASPSLYQELINKAQFQLASWKSRLLNLEGRSTLINSVTMAMPSHVLQSTWLPSSICNKLDQMDRSFLWESNSNIRKVHPIK
ncbi:hypothetical protein BUALT_Bualt11G0002600 [Buddleja alternifolia]|uniref:Reverse transcriptase domain-containing protein n=1 Tax=Buddleja alternifolia TaxID=168488 RepID=A0AAV6WWE8_9LAMI|nr:hypothetical protein BUALT_Bualt11G0002600 [Buddleja alternifolia]